VGEKETKPFQFTFNGFLKVAFQGSRVTFDAGLILVRELDKRSGLERLIGEHLKVPIRDDQNGNPGLGRRLSHTRQVIDLDCR
jgi:hypothetical protein